MGQKVNPVGFRTGIMRPWKSRWYASKQDYAGLLIEDFRIRNFVNNHPGEPSFRNAGIDRIEIERTRDDVKIVVFVARPGMIIGRKGEQVEVLQNELQDLIGRRVNLKIQEVGRPELQAQIVAQDIAQQLVKRAGFRRTMKRAIDQTMEAGARGIKIQLAGRLGGAEMARCEKQGAGSIPLSTLRAKIDYGFTEALTAQGHIGVQVWVNQGMYEGSGEDGDDAQEGKTSKKPKKTYKR